MTPVLQDSCPVAPWRHAHMSRLPGTVPLDPARWLVVDEAYAGQMALRERLLAERMDDVHRLAPEARPAAEELLETVLQALAARRDFWVEPGVVRCPDGRVVPVRHEEPLVTIGRLVQEDFCLLLKRDDAHRLAGGILCFPAGWSLPEKFGRSLTSIHGPVAAYDAGIARRVQRLFDAVHPDRPLWRANALLYDDPGLFQFRTEQDRRPRPSAEAPLYLRSEAQGIRRLPVTGAVVFSIHTWIVPLDRLPEADRAILRARLRAGVTGDDHCPL